MIGVRSAQRVETCNSCSAELDRAYMSGVLKGLNVCRAVYLKADDKHELAPVFDMLIRDLTIDITMASRSNNIARA